MSSESEDSSQYDSDDLNLLDDEESDNDTNSKKSNNTVEKRNSNKTTKIPLKDAIKTLDERALYTEVDRFFRNKCDSEKIEKMVRIINNQDQISLRLLNWFAMKYSTTMETLETTNEDGGLELFDVKISYRARLNTHSKKYFDPFRRGRKFDYNYDKSDNTKVVETTLCQLNFFRWLIMHDLLDYVEENFEILKNKMGSFNIIEKKKKEVKKKEKNKKVDVKDKKEEMKIKVKRFTEDNTSKVVIVI